MYSGQLATLRGLLLRSCPGRLADAVVIACMLRVYWRRKAQNEATTANNRDADSPTAPLKLDPPLLDLVVATDPLDLL